MERSNERTNVGCIQAIVALIIHSNDHDYEEMMSERHEVGMRKKWHFNEQSLGSLVG